MRPISAFITLDSFTIFFLVENISITPSPQRQLMENSEPGREEGGEGIWDFSDCGMVLSISGAEH
jgi:hypothetical protein